MRKRILSVVLAATVVFTGLSFCMDRNVYAATPKITVSEAQAQPGDSVDLMINISDNPGITSIDFNIIYDSSQLELTGKVNGKLLGGTMNSQNYSKIPYYCGWINSLQRTNCTEDGPIITLTFKVKNTATNGKHAVSFTTGTVTGYNADIKKIMFEAKNGYIEVKNGAQPEAPVSPGGSSGGTVTEPSEPASPDTKEPEPGQELTDKQQKTIAGVEAMKIKYSSAKYSKTKKKVTLKYKRSNKNYRLDGYEIYKSTQKTKGFKKVAVTGKQTWTGKQTGKKGKAYYYKVRGIRTIAGKTYYTKWSDVKKVTIR